MKYKKLRTFILALVFAAVSLWYCGFEPAAAAGTEDEGSDFDINISCGLDGYGKYSTDLPVCLTVTGHSGDFRGRIRLIPYSENVNTSVNAYTKALSVSDGESVRVEFTIENPEVSPIFDVQIINEAGEICYTQSIRTTIRYTDDFFAGLLTDDPESLYYLDGMPFYIDSYSSYVSTRIFNINPKEISEDAAMLNIYDLIIINDFDTASLSDIQNEALKKWVDQGGLLVIGTGDGYDQSLGGLLGSWFDGNFNGMETVSSDFALDGFSALTRSAPMEYIPEASQVVIPDTQPVSEEAETAGENADSSETDPAGEENLEEGGEASSDIAIATVEDDQETSFISETLDQIQPVQIEAADLTIENSQSYPEFLCQTLKMGNGNIFILSYDLGSEAFGSWQYAMAALQNMILTLTDISQQGSFRPVSISDYYVQDMLSNYIDGRLPQIGIFVVIVVIYIALVSPLTYVLLKKKDKRHWIWGLVPLTAFLFTGIVFLAGSSARQGSPYMNYGIVLDIGEAGETYERSYFSITSPQNSGFDFTIGNQYTVRPVSSYNYQLFRRSSSSEEAFEDNPRYNLEFFYDTDATHIQVLNTNSFDTWYFESDQPSLLEQNVDINITYYDGSYTGTITNNTGYDLENAFLKLDHRIFLVDSLKAGESFDIDRAVSYEIASYYDVPGSIPALDEHPARRRMLNGYMCATALYIPYTVKPDYSFYAFVEGYPVDIVENCNYSVSGNVLLKKDVSLNLSENGIYSVPNILYGCTLLSGEIDSMDGFFYSDEAIFECNIPSQIKTVLSLNLQFENHNMENPLLYYFYNWTTENWDPVFEEDSSEMASGQLQPYIFNGKLRIMVEKTEKDTYESSALPVFSMTGREE